MNAIPDKLGVSQNVWCQLCQVECSSIQLYEKHLFGEKHGKNLQKVYVLVAHSTAVRASQLRKNSCNSNETGSSEGQGLERVSSKPDNLEAKKQKLLECGTVVQSVKVCPICNGACNGEKAFSDNLVGKKHFAQERALCTKGNSNPISDSNFETNSQDETNKTRENGASPWCEVYRISCTSSDCLSTRRQGKKHQKNLRRFQNSNTTTSPPSIAAPLPSTNPSTGVPENTEVDKVFVPASQVKKVAQSKVLEDVEVKKRKVLDCGPLQML